jgi:hypothetical protein
MKVEHLCDWVKRRETKSGANVSLGAAGDEEFDVGDLVHIFGEYE